MIVRCPFCHTPIDGLHPESDVSTVNIVCYECYASFLATPEPIIFPTNHVLFMYSFVFMGGPPCSILREM
jgi:hypothetical protein